MMTHEDTEQVIDVVAAVVRDGERVLLARRSHGHHCGLWEFPGGKLEPGEGLGDALVRELDEELSVVAHAGAHIGSQQTAAVGGRPAIALHFVEATLASDPIPGSDHDAVCWASRSEAAALPLAPMDRRFASRM
jgi:8-oxo-dGTP pyrophosphatase MutT (NUDIX family)